jgi:hypothetical protein
MREPQDSKKNTRRQDFCFFLFHGFLLAGILGSLLCLKAQVFAAQESGGKAPEADNIRTEEGCIGCHKLELDANHQLGCSSCHAGEPSASGRQTAHRDMISQPAHPDNMDKSCGSCHRQIVAGIRETRHFTLADEINLVRKALGAKDSIAQPADIPKGADTPTLIGLGDDLLRRRCLRCHVYWKGDGYKETIHGTGCAACHLSFEKGALQSHYFVRLPDDRQCLHCHYGNFVGADYYGRFEHDFNSEYRTPFSPEGSSERPYGVEYHQLKADVHKQAGMECIDCHSGAELMGKHGVGGGGRTELSCRSCHRSPKEGPLQVKTRRRGLLLTALPLSNPAHDRYGKKVGCGVCHAQWSFFDEGTHLIRLDTMDFSSWQDLTVQSSYEVEVQLEEALYGGGGFDKPFMQDKISGGNWLGLWLKSYGQRRWEKIVVCADEKQRLQVCRPLLDLHLSYVDDQQKVVFDSVPIKNDKMRLLPYTPHTIGKAGMFYWRRLQQNNDFKAEMKN